MKTDRPKPKIGPYLERFKEIIKKLSDTEETATYGEADIRTYSG